MQLAYAEGDPVDYRSDSSVIPSGRATVVDVLVDGDRAEPDYVIDLGFGPVKVSGSSLSPVAEP